MYQKCWTIYGDDKTHVAIVCSFVRSFLCGRDLLSLSLGWLLAYARFNADEHEHHLFAKFIMSHSILQWIYHSPIKRQHQPFTLARFRVGKNVAHRVFRASQHSFQCVCQTQRRRYASTSKHTPARIQFMWHNVWSFLSAVNYIFSLVFGVFS